MKRGGLSILARTWVRALAPLSAGDPRASAASRLLARAEPVEATQALADLVAAAPGDADATVALEALERAIAGPHADDAVAEAVAAVAAAAEEFGHAQVASLFVRASPARTLDDGELLPSHPALAEVSLGHRRQMARSANPERLARFVAERDPSVMRNVLVNPRLTEDLVLRIAARRPARADVLSEIWASRRWSVRRRVRTALVFNPYTDPAVSLKILPLLSMRDLKEAGADATLHPLVQEAARRLAASRRAHD